MSSEDKHYQHHFKGIKLDPYRIAGIYKINMGPRFTILKKVLRWGSGDKKNALEDIADIECACKRAREMIKEDEVGDTKNNDLDSNLCFLLAKWGRTQRMIRDENKDGAFAYRECMGELNQILNGDLSPITKIGEGSLEKE